MHRKRSLLVVMGLIVLVGLVAVVPLADDPAEGAGIVAISGDVQFDLASALENAVSGDVITLNEDDVLSRDAAVVAGVTLDDGGFSLKISSYLSVEGTFLSSGELSVVAGGAIAVANGGSMLVNNEGKNAMITGYFEVYSGGNVKIGLESPSTFQCLGNGKMVVEGTMIIGNGVAASKVEARNATATGTIKISENSTFLIHDILTIGSVPTVTTEMVNNTTITGKFTLGTSAYIMVYGQSSFKASNVTNSVVSTQFIILDKTYATEYKDASSSSKRVLVMPPTSNLKDYLITNWHDLGNNIITEEMNLQIGSVGKIQGEATPQSYRIVLAGDKSIRWVVNGIDKGSSGEESGNYGGRYTINVRSVQKDGTLPAIFKDGVPYVAGTSFIVNGDTTFTTSNNYPEPGDSLVPVLLVILGILSVILVICLILLRAKNLKET
ncbi:MAG: hypothetical protein FWC29_00140 [Methanomassiliicoccaceae archaeon]|nr:hypothetical protein [Methanomassiliicoccaceae archaeon]